MMAYRFDYCPMPKVYGVPDWSRTSGLTLRRGTLYPAELRGHAVYYNGSNRIQTQGQTLSNADTQGNEGMS